MCARPRAPGSKRLAAEKPAEIGMRERGALRYSRAPLGKFMPIRTLIIVAPRRCRSRRLRAARRARRRRRAGADAVARQRLRRAGIGASPLDPGAPAVVAGAGADQPAPRRAASSSTSCSRRPRASFRASRAACSTPRTCRCRRSRPRSARRSTAIRRRRSTRHYRVFDEAFAGLDHLICYSLKANSNQAVIATLARLGAGADVVSEGELRRALAAGVPPEKIVFSGVGKTARELAFGLDAGIHCFNVESEPELELLSEHRRRAAARRAASAIRINPDVDARTHEKISTGRKENKFGVPFARAREVYAQRRDAARASASSASTCISAASSPSSQPFDNAFALLSELVVELRADGHAIEHVDLGGGLGIPYRDDEAAPPLPAAYAEIVRKHMNKIGCRVIFEPGRLIAGNAGILVTEVLYVKEGGDRTFVIVDAAMNDLIRPTLYDA